MSGFAHSHPLSVWVGKKVPGGSGLQDPPPTLASWERVRIQPQMPLTCSSSPTVSHFLWAGGCFVYVGWGKIASGSLGLLGQVCAKESSGKETVRQVTRSRNKTGNRGDTKQAPSSPALACTVGRSSLPGSGGDACRG